MNEPMDGWMGGWMDGWMGGWMDGWMGGWMDGWEDGRMDGSFVPHIHTYAVPLVAQFPSYSRHALH